MNIENEISKERIVGIDTYIESIFTNTKTLIEIEKAFKVAYNAHEGIYRRTGEPFIVHPIEVALQIRSLGEGKNLIIPALLHDIIEDTEYKLSDIENQFGSNTANILDDLTKLNFGFDHNIDYVELIKKRLLLFGKEVIQIKLCDRLVNMRSLYSLPSSKIRYICNETLNFYVPFAREIGYAEISDELEILSLLYTKPKLNKQKDKYIHIHEKRAKFRLTKNIYNNFSLMISELSNYNLINIDRKDIDKVKQSTKRFNEALQDNQVPKIEDLLGDIGPIDLKGVYKWAVYLTNLSKRSKKFVNVLSKFENTKNGIQKLKSLDSEVGGIIDVIYSKVILEPKKYISDSIAKLIKHLI